MKEAAGELNMTVVTVIAVAALAALFYAFVWPQLKANLERGTKCASAICDCGTKTNGDLASCKYQDVDGVSQTVDCPCK